MAALFQIHVGGQDNYIHSPTYGRYTNITSNNDSYQIDNRYRVIPLDSLFKNVVELGSELTINPIPKPYYSEENSIFKYIRFIKNQAGIDNIIDEIMNHIMIRNNQTDDLEPINYAILEDEESQLNNQLYDINDFISGSKSIIIDCNNINDILDNDSLFNYLIPLYYTTSYGESNQSLSEDSVSILVIDHYNKGNQDSVYDVVTDVVNYREEFTFIESTNSVINDSRPIILGYDGIGQMVLFENLFRSEENIMTQKDGIVLSIDYTNPFYTNTIEDDVYSMNSTDSYKYNNTFEINDITLRGPSLLFLGNFIGFLEFKEVSNKASLYNRTSCTFKINTRYHIISSSDITLLT